jgi:G:T-mismatch repair DNA endonuclease (very short patch repair protein)
MKSRGRGYALPELPELRVDGYCEETRTVYEFVGCYWHRHMCLPFRDVTTVCGGWGTLVERYEKTMFRLE